MYHVVTDYPIAFDSHDHISPFGTRYDNTKNLTFVKKCEVFYGRKITVMDEGTAGGAIVKQFLDNGHDAIGLEGSDYNLRIKRAEWATIPLNLFTCDISRPFQIMYHCPYLSCCRDYRKECNNNEPALFDLITCWEVMEHIPEERLINVINNNRKHLAKNGRWMLTVCPEPQDHHKTQKERVWWINLFKENGFIEDKESFDFINPDWLRGPHQSKDSGSPSVVCTYPISLKLQ